MKSKTYIKTARDSGFSLVEILIYLALLGMILSVMLTTLLVIAEAHGRVVAARSIEQTAVLSLDRIAREVRIGGGLNQGDSVLDDDEGRLSIEREDDSDLVFFLDDGRLFLEIDEGGAVPLSYEEVQVESFFVERIETPLSHGVRVTLDLSREYQDEVLEQSFWTSAIFRESYSE